MESFINDAWRGEGRLMRRTKLRCLAFWPTVSTIHHHGQFGQELCHLFPDSDVGVEKCSKHSLDGITDWILPPPHSVIEEPDFVSMWEAQTRALLLSSSLNFPGLAPHFDAIFVDAFIKDARHPVPEEDLIELGIKHSDEHGLVATDEVMQPFATHGFSVFDASMNGPVQHRPDQNTPQNLPDPPEQEDEEHDDRERDRDPRIPLHRFPHWTTDLWNILQAEGATELLEEGPVIYLDSFYISHRHCVRQEVNRPVRLAQNYAQWADEILEVWQDYMDRNAGFDIFVVQPEPPIPVARGTVGTIIIAQHPDPRHVAVLTTTISDALLDPWIQDVAHSIEIHFNYRQILSCAGVLQNCMEVQRQGFGYCTLSTGNHQFPRDRPIRLHDGLGLVINIPMVVDDELWQNLVLPRFRAGLVPPDTDVGHMHQEADHTNLMARRPQPRLPFRSSSTSIN